MSSYSESGDTPFERYVADIHEQHSRRDSVEALTELLNFPLAGKQQLGKAQSRYNGAERIDIARVAEPRLIRSPYKFLTILKNLEIEANISPSYGLKVKKGTKYDYVHYVLELNHEASVGVFFFDSKRLLSVPQVHNIERLIKLTGLKGAIIIANHVGIPAKQEAKRINREHGGYDILTIEHYSSIEKRYLENQ